MASVLLSALAGMGAAEHAVTVAERLRTRGHRVSVVTSAAALQPYRRLGLEVHEVVEPPMPQLLPGLPPVVQRARQLLTRVQQVVIDPLPEQWRVVRRVIEDAAVDVVVTDPLFLGGSMLAALPREDRPAVVMLGFAAPWYPDPGVPPYGMGIPPADDEQADRLRTRGFNLIAARAMVRLSRSFNEQVERTFGVRREGDLRTTPALADVFAQLSVPRFEYPRTALPENFRFVGPLAPQPGATAPTWWSPDDESPVVAVRATSATAVQDLVLPTLQAFAGTASTVVVAGVGRRGVAAAWTAELPADVHVEQRLPWARLQPRRTVVVSDGDHQHVQHALRRGIPLVVAGTLETDVETAARVAWTGAGVDLRTRRPTPKALRAAVERVRADPLFRGAAARIAAQIATTDAEGSIAEIVEELAAAR